MSRRNRDIRRTHITIVTAHGAMRIPALQIGPIALNHQLRRWADGTFLFDRSNWHLTEASSGRYIPIGIAPFDGLTRTEAIRCARRLLKRVPAETWPTFMPDELAPGRLMAGPHREWGLAMTAAIEELTQ